MARSQFTFTFANAQPGAAVTFSDAVYSSPVDAVADGPTLALDSQRTVAVWTDAVELTATWVDGAGASITAEASLDRPIVTATGGVPGTTPTASSSAVPAVPDGVTITDADNTYSGTGTYKVTNTPDGEDVFLAVGEAGDSFPRLVMLTDGSLFFGDGTADPLAAGTGLVTFQGGRLQLGIPSDATTAPTVAHDDTVTGFGAPTVKAALDYIATNYGAELAAHEARITALETP